jgi:hypothetical protein
MPDYIPLLNDILDHVEGQPGWQVLGIAAEPGEHLPGFATLECFPNLLIHPQSSASG